MARETAPVARFAASTLLVLVVAAVAGWGVSVQIARSEAIDEAAEAARTMAERIASPYVAADSQAPGYAEGLRRLDEHVRGRIADAAVLRVKVWKADGTILYSDENQLVGRRFALGPDERNLFVNGGVHAELSDLDASENVLDRELGQDADAVVETYAAFDSTDGSRLVFEAYIPVRDLLRRERQITARVLPVALGAPLVVAAALFPLAVRMSHSVREAERDAVRALRRVFEAGRAERRRLSRCLHDDAIPGLASVSLELDALSLAIPDSPERDQLDRLAATVRTQIEVLRGLLSAENEASSARVGLAPALEWIAERCRAEGLEVLVQVDADDLDAPECRLVQAVVSEGLRNACRHSGGSRVAVRVDNDRESLVIEVADDGAGFAREGPGVRPDHGLGLLADTIAELGGSTHLTNRSHGGASLTVRVPRSSIADDDAAAGRADRIARGEKG